MFSPPPNTASWVAKFSDLDFSEASESNMAVADKNMVSETESGGGMCTNVGNTPVS